MPINIDPLISPLLTSPLPAKPKIYLTFDDGPYPATEDVLNALRTADIKATFFLCAKNLNNDKELQYRLIKRMMAEGHSLGNHGYDHEPFTMDGYKHSTTQAVKKDFTDNVEKLDKLFRGHKDSFPGFPVGRLPGEGKKLDAFVRMITNEVGIPHAGWDFEFSRTGLMRHVNKKTGVEGVVGEFDRLPNPEDVVLLHDLHWKGKDNSELLLKLLLKLKENFSVRPLSPVPHTPTVHYKH